MPRARAAGYSVASAVSGAERNGGIIEEEEEEEEPHAREHAEAWASSTLALLAEHSMETGRA